MKMKKLIALFMAALMLVACFAGCAKPDDNQNSSTPTGGSAATDSSNVTNNTEEDSLFNVGSLPIVNEPVTLKVLTVDPTDKEYATAADAGYWKWLEEQTGVHFEVESYSSEELANKLPLIMATPDQMPDLFISCGFKEQDIINYAQNGQLLKLNDLIDQYGTNIKTMFEENPTAVGASVLADGSIYSMPAMNGAPSQVMYAVNTRFLENSGVAVPATLEELAAALKTMRTKDANGDGTVGNEILWSCEPKSFKRQALSLVGVACYWPWQGVIMDDHDGEVYFVPTSEEYKYLLSVLRDLYKEGCIDQEIFTQTFDEHVAKFDQDLVFMGEYTDDPETATFKGMTGWTYIKPVTSAVHDDPTYVVASEYQYAMGAVSAYTEYPEVCALVLDYMYSEEASIASKYGLEGVDFTVKTEEPWVIETISSDIPLGCGYTPITAPRWLTADVLQPAATELQRTRIEMRDTYGRFGWQNYLHLTTVQSDAINVLATDLGLFCDDYWVGFINGTYDLDKDWDSYVKACEQMGVADLTAIYQDAYNVFFGVE